MREILAREEQELNIGKRGENLATCVVFDVSAWEKTYGSGVVQLIHRRNGDKAPYPCDIEADNGKAYWTVTNTDVAIAGRGHAELQYYVGDVLVKSATYATRTTQSMAAAGDVPPEPGMDWVEQALRAGMEATASAEAAENSAASASASAELAVNTAAGISSVAEEVAQVKEYSDKAAASVTAAEAAQAAAERARDEARDIAGADYATVTQAQNYASTAERNANSYTDNKVIAHNTNAEAHEDIRAAVAEAKATAEEAKTAVDNAPKGLTGESNPTENIEGVVGQMYWNSKDETLWVCTGVEPPETEVLFAEQSVESDDLISNIEVSLRDHVPIVGDTYIVTVDGIQYRCKAYNSEYGDICIGDSRLAVNDESNPEDVPFGIDTYSMSDDSGWNVWQEWYVLFSYAGTHTLKIERVVGESDGGYNWTQVETDIYQVGDVRTSIRADLGDKWLLCNGDTLSATECPKLYGMLQDMNPPYEATWSAKNELWDANGYVAPINDMAYGEGYYVAVGQTKPYNTGEDAESLKISVASALDGSWSSKASLYSSYPNAAATSVAYGNGMFVVGGYFRGSSPYTMYGLIYYADDPSGTWTRKNLWSSVSNENKVMGVAYGDGTWVAAGEYHDGSNYYARIAYTTDPTGDWTTKDIFTGTSKSRFQIKSVAYAEGNWVVVGLFYDGTNRNARIMYTTSLGGTWTTKDLWSDTGSYSGAFSVTYGDGVWAVAGNYNDGSTNGAKIAYSSSLGGEWTVVANTKFNVWHPVDIAYANGLWAIGGQRESDSQGCVAFAHSLDGEWQFKIVTSYASSSNTYVKSVKNLDGAWVAMGNEYYSSYGNGIFVSHSTVLPTITTDGAYCYIKAKG